MKERLQILLWRSLAAVCVALAVLGVVLPVLPTVPFLLLAAWAGGKGWPRLERWLLEHPRHGPAIRRWRERRAVPRRAKWLAAGMLTASGVLVAFSPVPPWLRIAVAALLLAVGVWLWRRPDA